MAKQNMEVYQHPELPALEYHELPGYRYVIFVKCGDSLVFREYNEGAFFLEDKTTGRWGRITGFNDREKLKQYIKDNLQDTPL